MHRLTDLRVILQYVPRFREQLFVIALDGAIVEDPNFRNLLLDLALLHSLRIKVVLVHGGSHQIQRLARQSGITPSDLEGHGVTDPDTLEVALYAISRVSHELLEGLSICDLRGATSNVVVAHPAGILQGIDQQCTGRIDRIDTGLLRSLLENNIIPVVPPLGCDGEGNTYRLSSDDVAAEVSLSLRAVKLIYLTSFPGIEKNGSLLRQLTIEEASALLKDERGSIRPEAARKLQQAVRATRGGVPRAHIIDGRVEEGLLAEVFSNEGIGTLIHANEYRSIRRAEKKDARAIHALIQSGVENDELLQRSREELEGQIEDFYVLEVDERTAGCAALFHYPGEDQAELACVCVDQHYENQGIGLRLVQYIVQMAQQLPVKQLFCLSTQAYNFFIHKAGFHPATPDQLPAARRESYEKSGRRSRVLIKPLDQDSSCL